MTSTQMPFENVYLAFEDVYLAHCVAASEVDLFFRIQHTVTHCNTLQQSPIHCNRHVPESKQDLVDLIQL